MLNPISYINVLLLIILMGIEAFDGPKIISQTLVLAILIIWVWSLWQDLRASRIVWRGVGLIAGIATGIALGILWTISESFRAFGGILLALLVVLKAICISLLSRYPQHKR